MTSILQRDENLKAGMARSVVLHLALVGGAVGFGYWNFGPHDTWGDPNAIPGAGNPANTGILSEVFSMRNDSASKSELVIFLRATVINNPSVDSEELKFFERLLPKQTDSPNDQQNQKTGAAK